MKKVIYIIFLISILNSTQIVKSCYEGKRIINCKNLKKECKNYKFIRNRLYNKENYIIDAYFFSCKKKVKKICIVEKNKREYEINCDRIRYYGNVCGKDFYMYFKRNKTYKRSYYNLDTDFYKCVRIKEKVKMCIVKKNNKEYRKDCNELNNVCGKNYYIIYEKNKIYNKSTRIINTDFYKCKKIIKTVKN
jgi:hypothetical protein